MRAWAIEEVGDYSLGRMLSGPSSSVTADDGNSGENKNEIFLAPMIRPSFPFRHCFYFAVTTFMLLVESCLTCPCQVSPPLSPIPKAITPVLFLNTTHLLISNHLFLISQKIYFSQDTQNDFL